jgi:hypothetical protein
MRWHDVSATVGTMYGIYLGELLIHGDDVAPNHAPSLANHRSTWRDHLRRHR